MEFRIYYVICITHEISEIYYKIVIFAELTLSLYSDNIFCIYENVNVMSHACERRRRPVLISNCN